MENVDLNTVEHQQALLVRNALAEALSPFLIERFDPRAVLAGMSTLLNDYIANATNQATASAYFFGMAKHAAILAAQDLPPKLKH